MVNSHVITYPIQFLVSKLAFIITSYFLNFQFILIFTSLDKQLENIGDFALVIEIENPYVSRKVIHNYKSIFIATNTYI